MTSRAGSVARASGRRWTGKIGGPKGRYESCPYVSNGGALFQTGNPAGLYQTRDRQDCRSLLSSASRRKRRMSKTLTRRNRPGILRHQERRHYREAPRSALP